MQGLSEASPRVRRERGIHARSRSGVARRPGSQTKGGEMNRVDRSREFDAQGRALVSDPPIMRLVHAEIPPDPPVELFEDEPERELVALMGRINSGIAVQLLLDRRTGETFVTTVVAGECLTVPVEPELALDTYKHPGFYGLLPQLG